MRILLDNVIKRFGGTTAVEPTHLDIADGELFTLLGPSGCGKTTLLRLIAGFDFPTEGEILLYGQDIAALPPFKRPVNTVFQNYSLFPHMTVGQNIGFGLEMVLEPAQRELHAPTPPESVGTSRKRKP